MKNAFDLGNESLAEHLYEGVTDLALYTQSMVDALKSPIEHSPLAVKAWLKSVIYAFEVKPTNWAKSAGLAPSTINRFLAEQDFSKNLSARTINKLSRSLPSQVENSTFEFWENVSSKTSPNFSFQSVIKDCEVIDFLFDEPHDIVPLEVIGISSTEEHNLRIEQSKFNLTRKSTIYVPIPSSYAHFRVVGFNVSTDRYDPVYVSSSVLVCLPIKLWADVPPVGARLIIHELISENAYNISIREFIVDPSGRGWLMPLKGTPSYNDEPVFIDGLATDRKLKATFMVIASYQFDAGLRVAQNSA